MLTVAHISEFLGIKPSTIYSWVTLNKIPYIKIHGLIRFDPAEIRQWLESFKQDQVKKLPRIAKKEEANDYLDRLIAGAKREVYNSSIRGNQTNKIEPPRKGGEYGAL